MFAFMRPHNTSRINENWKRIDPDWSSFRLRFIWNVFAFKNFHFLVSLSLHKCWKSLSSKTTLMTLNWKIMDHTMSTIIHVSWIKLLGTHFLFDAVSTRILQEVHFLSEHNVVCFQWQTLQIFSTTENI